jgi:hypothetical protein
MRMCQFSGCGSTFLAAVAFACPEHWNRLSANQQERVYEDYSRWQRGEIDRAELRLLRRQVVAEVEQARTNRKTPARRQGGLMKLPHALHLLPDGSPQFSIADVRGTVRTYDVRPSPESAGSLVVELRQAGGGRRVPTHDRPLSAYNPPPGGISLRRSTRPRIS